VLPGLQHDQCGDAGGAGCALERCLANPYAVTDGPKKVVQARLTGSFGVTSSRGRSPVLVLPRGGADSSSGEGDGTG